MSADRFFKRDSISGKFSIYEGGGIETPATYDEVVDLECAAVWDPEHVESRLDDHYAGVENLWVKSLSPEKSPSRTRRWWTSGYSLRVDMTLFTSTLNPVSEVRFQ